MTIHEGMTRHVCQICSAPVEQPKFGIAPRTCGKPECVKMLEYNRKLRYIQRQKVRKESTNHVIASNEEHSKPLTVLLLESGWLEGNYGSH